jgi:hypothetical protein
MRQYIFTALERQRLKRFLAGEKNKAILNILSRIRVSKVLASDIQLYLKVCEAMKTV